ncbi:hypothetical protein YC2023_089751 [Brassica napus]
MIFINSMVDLKPFKTIWKIKSDLWTSTAGATSRSDGMRSLCTTSRSDSSRATAQGRSRFHVWRHTFTPRSDLPERRAEVAPEAQSDHTRATGRSRSRFHHPETRERARSDLSQRHSEVAPEAWSDMSERRAESNHNASSELATQLLILRHFSPERCSMKCPRQLS